MSIEAMKQAMERAMEVLERGDAADPITFGETIDALRAAIEQAEKQESWALREVLFADGEAIAHRKPEKQELQREWQPLISGILWRKTHESKKAY
jgi:hypothetical protein